MSLGFRSSFNFVPEGTYAVEAAFRGWLTEHGFEVGVHDLHHDGTLYRSRAAFRENARRINLYLKAWKASGFRSGFMLHNLDWIHDLDIAYDSSTFDTDPFEPQPDAAGTIFPFWVPPPEDGIARGGYVELPYTLPQDSTLYLLLREKTPEIWLRKLDWIARQEGMALVNVHPDYLRFPGEPPSPKTFPVRHYVRLLEHLRDAHARRVLAAAARGALAQEVAPGARAAPAPAAKAGVPGDLFLLRAGHARLPLWRGAGAARGPGRRRLPAEFPGPARGGNDQRLPGRAGPGPGDR